MSFTPEYEAAVEAMNFAKARQLRQAGRHLSPGIPPTAKAQEATWVRRRADIETFIEEGDHYPVFCESDLKACLAKIDRLEDALSDLIDFTHDPERQVMPSEVRAAYEALS